MNTNINKIPGPKIRIKELLFDWAFISLYLIMLFGVMSFVFLVLLDGFPEYTALQSQLIAAFTSVIPIVLVFSIMEGRENYASFGKRKMNLMVSYKGNPMAGSFIRNTLKFLPWQFGHMSTINGVYNGFDTPFSITFFTLSIVLSISYIVLTFFSNNNRHLADMIAGSTVEIRNNNRIN